eukprot:maker-scaffold994_size72573-snap-gene-0.14 protein:Tk02417 transcript:maker-scaffold994_size72573-snap-gene-0.14-mRNA-1 annotation:"PREDICTED: hypothetical protein LOC100636423"
MATSRICHFNARSILNKKSLLDNVLVSEDFDIVFVSETWCHEGVLSSELESAGRKDRRDTQSGRGGGVMILWRSEAYVHELHVPLPHACGIRTAGLNLVCVYLSPNASQWVKESTNLYINGLEPGAILVGDFNYPKIVWLSSSATGKAELAFVEATNAAGLTQVVDFPTHVAGNILDLIFTDDPELI